MPMPKFKRELNHKILPAPTAFVTSRFFLGTTEPTTTKLVLRSLRIWRRYEAVNRSVGTRRERDSAVLDAKASLVNELLMSISRYSENRTMS